MSRNQRDPRFPCRLFHCCSLKGHGALPFRNDGPSLPICNGFIITSTGTHIRHLAVGSTIPGTFKRNCVDFGGFNNRVLRLHPAVFLNGCAWLPDQRTLLICESITGRILAINRIERRFALWTTDEQLQPVNKQMPLANGIKYRAGCVYVSVTDRNKIVKLAVRADNSAGPVEVVAENLRADDFAFGTSGALYIATHPAHTVLRLTPEGDRVTLAGSQQGAAGSTSCAFGGKTNDETSLYVTTSGGLWAPYHGEVQEARLLRLEVGEAGEALPPVR